MRRDIASLLALVIAAAGSSFAWADSAPAPLPPVPQPPAQPPPPPAPTSSIGPLTKQHNVDVGNQRTGVLITAPIDLVGVAGQTVAVVVWFYDAAGQPIRSALAGWGDSTNHLRVVSSNVYPKAASEHVDLPFQVPYCAFPRRQEGRYSVEARALLVQRVGDGRVILARRSTTFFVE